MAWSRKKRDDPRRRYIGNPRWRADEEARVRAAIDASGLSTSEFIRTAVLEKVKQTEEEQSEDQGIAPGHDTE